MAELDLDALEHDFHRRPTPDGAKLDTFLISRQEAHSLIQRLREAEAHNWTLFQAREGARKSLEIVETRIAQLERVREAAIVHVATDPVRDMAPFIVSRTNLRAALAAVEEGS